MIISINDTLINADNIERINPIELDIFTEIVNKKIFCKHSFDVFIKDNERVVLSVKKEVKGLYDTIIKINTYQEINTLRFDKQKMELLWRGNIHGLDKEMLKSFDDIVKQIFYKKYKSTINNTEILNLRDNVIRSWCGSSKYVVII